MERKRSSFPRLLLLLLILVGLVFIALAFLRAGGEPGVEIEASRPGIGASTDVTVRASEGDRGLRTVRVELLQDPGTPTEKVWLLDERTYQPRPFWAFWGPRTTEDEITVAVGKDVQKELRPGEAVVRVSVGRADTWLRHPDDRVVEEVMPVDFKPPVLSVSSRPNRARQGGSGAVAYRVSEDSVRDGVEVGELFFPGFPLPGADPASGDRFALFAAPYDLADSAPFRLVAEDALGNRAERAFLDAYTPRPPTQDRIELSDAFMEKVVPEILGQTPDVEDKGDLLANYLALNGDLRRANARTLRELAAQTRPEPLWEGPFRQLTNSAVMAPFADHRTYVYEGREVDQQDHLGFDLASRRQAPVEASNAGVVVMARYFGIYGNTVVIDHGYGLASLYAHLSRIDVEEGQEVKKDEVVGLTGETGLAGGDHLHFTMMVHGQPVNPIEWWDARWIRDQVTAKMGLEGEEGAP